MARQKTEKHTLAILKVRGFDEDVELGYYLVKEGGKSPLEMLRAAAVESAESDRSWEATDLPYCWGDFLWFAKEDILLKHGIEKVAFSTPGVGLLIDKITELEVDGAAVLVENSQWLERQKFKFEPYMSCGLAAVTLCWPDAESETHFFLVDPELKGQIENAFKKAAIDYIRAKENGRFNNGFTWGELFCSVTSVDCEPYGLMHVTDDSFDLLNPHFVWIEGVVLDSHADAVTAAEVAQIE